MTILMVCWEFPPEISGGMGVASAGLVRGLAALGEKILLALPLGLPVELPDGVEVMGGAARHGDEVASGYSPDIAYSGTASLIGEVVAFGRRVERLAATRAFDLVHCHDWLTVPAALTASRLSGRPLVMHVHSLEVDRAGDEANPSICEIERLGLLAADRVIAVSDHTRCRLVEQYGIDRGRVDVVHNATDRVVGVPFPALPTGARRRVLFMGRVTWQKGPEQFIRAAARLAAERDDIEFVMAGDGDLRPAMVELADELGLGGRVVFPGFVAVADVPDLLRSADVFVMTSMAEPFGIVALEAAAQGVPVVLPASAGVVEAMPQAVRYTGGDVEQLAVKIGRLLDNEALRQRAAQRQQERARRLTWRDAAAAVRAVYHQLVPSPGAP